MAQARRFNEESQAALEQAFKEESDAYFDERANVSAEERVKDSLTRQLRAAGRSKDVAENEVMPMVKFLATAASRMKGAVGDVANFASSLGIKIKGPDDEIAGRKRGALDLQLNTLRARGLKPTGTSLNTFLRERGGLRDFGGELAAMGAPRGLVAATREQIQREEGGGMFGPGERKGLSLDDAAAAAAEAGFFPEFSAEVAGLNEGVAPDMVPALLEAIEREVGGDLVFRDGEGVDPDLAQLAAELDEMGIDISDGNDAIIEAIDRASRERGEEFFQPSPPINSQAFKDWFAESKVVDENGDPLVVHYGTNASVYSEGSFEAFNTNGERGGAFFSSDRRVAETYGQEIYDVYLSIQNPLVVDAEGKSWTSFDTENIIQGIARGDIQLEQESSPELDALLTEVADLYADEVAAGPAPEQSDDVTLGDLGARGTFIDIDDIVKVARKHGFDGLQVKNVKDGPVSDSAQFVADTFVVFSPEQIKSVDNSGGFDPKDARIMYQSEIDRGGRSVQVQRNGDAVLTPVQIEAQGLDRKGAMEALKGQYGEYTLASGEFVKLSRLAKKTISGTVPGKRFDLIPKLSEIIETAHIYAEKAGASYAAALVQDGDVQVAVRLVLKSTSGLAGVYAVEGFSMAPIKAWFDAEQGSSVQELTGGHDGSRPKIDDSAGATIQVDQAVSVFNTLGKGRPCYTTRRDTISKR